jgi:hypothetical protein
MKTCGSDGGLGEVVEIDKGPQRQGNQSPTAADRGVAASDELLRKDADYLLSNPKLSFHI